ncbi:hypothetical protein OHA18_15895 [Kribbella sp. NBC_00709]|uniref:hypothetical protein n=1 Tax=Kribbella sp. NBC_00709 TaxID=2975972 RepID=UPI002E2DAA3B|nr:hypothetical protein [Kribbella sp. NBC_00709]
MSTMVQKHTGRPMKDDAGRFAGSSPAGDRSAICDAMADAYAGDSRHQGLVRGMARQVAVRDVDNMVAASNVPDGYRAILDQRAAGEPEPADVRDRVRQAAAAAFVETLGEHIGDRRSAPEIARTMLAASHGPGQQPSPLRAAATALFRASAEAQAMIPPEQHAHAITGIQQAMEQHAGLIDGAAQGLTGHSGLPPREFEQTLLEARMAGTEIAGFGIEAVERLAHPPAPTGAPIQAATVDIRAAQEAASSGVASASDAPTGGAARPESTPADPRPAHRLDSQETHRSGSREV